ncbi:MAG TPA: ABC transporter permease [Candidatus Sulfopaludibacter sp.]|jgi:putative ABC transport system permease protein|nr:ABC transporter permease [Candidatus Sulfopaludibacter sp.]
MTDLFADFRFAARSLRKRPGFLVAAVTVLALGIGANTAIFSLVNAFLLKPLVMRNPEQLVGLYSRDIKKPDSYRAFSYPNYADIRQSNPVFSELTAHNMAMVGVTEGQQTRRVFADIVSANFFETFGVPLYRGRAFSLAEERPSSAVPVAIVSYSFWKKGGADPEILGKTVRINGRDYHIVGIAPEGFTGTTALVSSEIYLPLGMYEFAMNDFEGRTRPLSARDNHCLIVIGRLRNAITHASADRQLQAVAAGLAQAYPAENRDQALIVESLSRVSVSDAPERNGGLYTTASLLLAASGVILLIASLNVANMMLARGSARRKEIAIRLALGGSRADIVRQLFTEGLLLSLLGGAGGLVTAYWSTLLLMRSLSTLAPFDLVFNAQPDLRVLAATLGFCLFSTLLFSLMPAWNLSRPNLVAALKSSQREEAGGAKPRRIFSRRNILVICQVSLSLTLLTAAGLFMRSSFSAAHVNPGFLIERELLLETDSSLAGYSEARGRQLYPAVAARLQSLPGVESASIGATVPFGTIHIDRRLQTTKDAKPVSAAFNIVGPDYFRTLGIQLQLGRTFTASDERSTGAAVGIIDQLAARRLWPGEEPVGRHVQMNLAGDQKQDVEIVGVVANTRQGFLGDDEMPHVFVPFGQEYQADTHIHVRLAAGVDAGAMIQAVRRAVQAEDANLPILKLTTMRDHLESSLDYWIVRTGADMFGIFGGVALLLATIGLYGVRSYSVAMRTREIGIRMALGARPAETLRMVLREGLMLTAIGLGIGLPLSLGLSTLLAGMLYGVSGSSAVVMAAASVVLALVGAAACYVPARRAATVDPLEALRYE